MQAVAMGLLRFDEVGGSLVKQNDGDCKKRTAEGPIFVCSGIEVGSIVIGGGDVRRCRHF